MTQELTTRLLWLASRLAQMALDGKMVTPQTMVAPVSRAPDEQMALMLSTPSEMTPSTSGLTQLAPEPKSTNGWRLRKRNA